VGGGAFESRREWMNDDAPPPPALDDDSMPWPPGMRASGPWRFARRSGVLCDGPETSSNSKMGGRSDELPAFILIAESFGVCCGVRCIIVFEECQRTPEEGSLQRG
jgi:hypothetical protein